MLNKEHSVPHNNELHYFFSGNDKETPSTIQEKLLRLDAERAKMLRESKPPAVQYPRRKPLASATTDADNTRILKVVMKYLSLTYFTNLCRKTQETFITPSNAVI